MSFELNLSRMLAHSMVFFTREEWLPVSDARGEDPAAPPAGRMTEEAVGAFTESLPAYLHAVRQGIVPYERQRTRAMERFSPRQTELQTRLFEQFAPRLAETGFGIEAAGRMRGAEADRDVLAGPGAESARLGMGLLREMDPEYYNLRGQTADSIGSLLSGGLTPAEEEAISRQLARENASLGLLGTPSATGTVANAMTFGNAARNRQLQGIGAATSFLPTSRSAFDPVQVALGRPSFNTGQSEFRGVSEPSGMTEQLSQGLMDQVGGFTQQWADIRANRRDFIDRGNEITGAAGSVC